QRNRIVRRHKLVLAFVEHHAVDELGQRRRAAEARGGLLRICAPAEARAALEARIDPLGGELVDRYSVVEHVELDAGFLTPQPHEAALLFERAGRWIDRERKSELLHRARERRLARQLAAKEHMRFRGHARNSLSIKCERHSARAELPASTLPRLPLLRLRARL